MQLCSLGGADSLGSQGAGGQSAPAPLVFASPGSKAKLLLLERRLTGSNPARPAEAQQQQQQQQATDGMLGAALAAAGAAAADSRGGTRRGCGGGGGGGGSGGGTGGGNGRAAPSIAAKLGPVEVVIIDPSQEEPHVGSGNGAHQAHQQQQQQQHSRTGRRSPAPLGGAEAAGPSSKRRKTARPQHRPAAGDQGGSGGGGGDSKHGGGGGGADGGGGGGGRDTAQRDKPARARASPRAADAGVQRTAAGDTAGAGAGAGGSSNPPMSPSVAAVGGPPPPVRTPRSGGKQHGGAAHGGKGQTNISRYFPLLTDGSSRDSDTPSALLLHHQQQQQQQQLEALQLHASPVEGLLLPDLQAQQAPQRRSSGGGDGGGVKQQQQQLEQKHQQEVEALREEARQREAQLAEQLAASQRQAEGLQGLLQQLQQELAAARSGNQERQAAVQAAVSRLVVHLSVSEGSLQRLRLGQDASRLGTLGFSRAGALGFTEVWEDGPALRDLAARKAALQRSREEVEAARKALKRRLPPPPRATPATAAAPDSAAAGGSQDAPAGQQQQQQQHSQSPQPQHYISSAEYVTQDEIFKVRLSVIRREEEQLAREEERLTHEKMSHLRALKRLRDEECSRFSAQPTLHGRYVLASLLGRGGFSEVHRAYDLAALKWVAVKVHQLNSGWSEARKAAYVRHAVREYTIHKALRHPNIVSLTDIFEVDNTTFATVLELCEGGDLEGHLQAHQTLPEREARALIAQVFAGLAYLNRGGVQPPPPAAASSAAAAAAASPPPLGPPAPRVIHYDLKPANVLFDSLGAVKITDFGLSKVVEEGQTMGMELTSQGAGTYWYLPPECFQAPGAAAAGGGGGRGTGGGAAGAGGRLLPAGLIPGGGGAAGPAAGAALAAAGPRISNKVDVWSAGVILYQMLYGRRPFGEGLSQEQVYRDGVMLNARQVQFPPKPAVSAEGKAFLARCLAYSQDDRWDVLTAAADPYLQLRR